MKKSELKSIKKGVIRLIKAVRDSAEDCPYPYLPNGWEIKVTEDGDYFAQGAHDGGWNCPSRQAAVTTAWVCEANEKQREIEVLKIRLADSDPATESIPLPPGCVIEQGFGKFRYADPGEQIASSWYTGKSFAVAAAWKDYVLKLNRHTNVLSEELERKIDDLTNNAECLCLPPGFKVDKFDNNFCASRTGDSDLNTGFATRQAAIAFAWQSHSGSQLNKITTIEARLRDIADNHSTPTSQAVRDVLADRQCMTDIGWTAEKIDATIDGQLVQEALNFAAHYDMNKSTARYDLIRAVSMLVLEIERFDRIKAKEEQS